ncbi:arylsulfatase [Galbibacter sp. PAP.153]|uniref:arylsulfatase n=1 Tax=Galbibacter sp. PAP.153 TaxID=3104623 RepID=UPI00300B82A5
MKTNFMVLKLLLTGILLSNISCEAPKKEKGTAAVHDTEKPNIVLILTDDLGYSDIGAYGSQVQTPNLNALASSGVSFREFYNVGICAPTRASLLSGQYQHDAGVGFFSVNLGIPAYQGYLNTESLTIAEVLNQNGYRTYLSGKWHLGNEHDQLPNQRGFDAFFGFPGGASSYFSQKPFTGEPLELYHNNTPFQVKDSTFYLTDAITTEAIKMVSNTNRQEPFFLYLAFNAPHWPLQAPPADIEKYKGKFDKGWDQIRKERRKRLIEKGLVSSSEPISERPSTIPAWDELSGDEQKHWAKYMEVHAAMIDRVDQNIGRLIARLKENGQFENTVFFFLSDNGAAGEDVNRSFGNIRPTDKKGEVGTVDSYRSITHRWAYAANTPFTYWKTFPYEGGISSPFIASFPKRFKENTIVTGRGHLIDIFPTILELSNISYPDSYKGNEVLPLAGNSLLPQLTGVSDVKNDTLFFEWSGNKAIRANEWKLLTLAGDKKWKLFNMEKDREETSDVSNLHPELVQKLNDRYKAWASSHHVVDTDSLLRSSPNGKGMSRFREGILKTIDQ